MSNDAPPVYPALFVVPRDGSYTDVSALPHVDDVRQTVSAALSDVWGSSGATEFLMGVRKQAVEIQHESVPTEPYDATAVVIIFGQLPILESMGGLAAEDPFNLVVDGLNEAFGDSIEFWLDAVEL